MRFEFFVSRRYLASRERRGLISLITFISIGGVAVGVAALIVVIGVMDGFDKELMDRIMGASSHVTIRHGWTGTISDYRKVVALAEADPDVVAASPLISRQALLSVERKIGAADMVGIRIMGFDLEREKRITSFIRDVALGSAEPGDHDIVLQTLPRQNLRAVQTPQVFRYDVIKNTYKFTTGDVTDDAALVEKAGYKVKLYMGSYDNIKITAPDDLAVAEALLK